MSKKKTKIIWCDAGYLPIAFGYCPDADAWRRFTKRVKSDAPWPNCAGGFMSWVVTPTGTYYVVSVNPEAKKWDAPFDVDGILLHEGVHVWQWAVDYIREENPSREFEALSIQHIVHELKKAYRKAHR